MVTRPRQYGVQGLEQNVQDAAFDVHDLETSLCVHKRVQFHEHQTLCRCPAHGNTVALDAVCHFHSCVLEQGNHKRWGRNAFVGHHPHGCHISFRIKQ